MALPWPLSKDGVTVADLQSVLDDDRVKEMARDLNLCQRIKIEATYASFIEDQEEDVELIRNEETLLIPDDIDYNE